MNNVGETDEVSKEMLERFEEVATEDNLQDLSVLGGQSIQVTCKCGCMHVHHILHGCGTHLNKDISVGLNHAELHYIELCNQHALL